MNLLSQTANNILHQQLFLKKDKLLLAVSGGVDSIVLCELCFQLGYNFSIAHCNFQLRGKESERDELFVKNLEIKYAVEVFTKQFDTTQYANSNKISIQEAARNLRYEWFDELITKFNIQYLLTAHHRDDNIETVLMNFFKGTGITGLRGIRAKNNKIVRPVLFASKEDLLSFAKENKLEWVEDSSNAETHYSRNKFRHEIIPALKEIFPAVEENLNDNIRRFADIEIIYRQGIDSHKKRLLEKRGSEIHIPILKLKKSIPLSTIVYEIIKDFGFSTNQTEEVVGLLDSDSGKYIVSRTHRVIKNRNWLIITCLKNKESETILIENEKSEIEFEIGKIKFEKIENNIKFKVPDLKFTACLNADELQFPFLLRKVKQADYFYPLGLRKKKKLHRFFIDQKLALTEKEKIWVVESNQKIVWVIGHRIDDRFKITKATKNILKISLEIF